MTLVRIAAHGYGIFNGEVEGGLAVLRHVGKRAGQRIDRILAQRLLAQRDSRFGRVGKKPCNELQQRGLPRTVRTDDGTKVPLRNLTRQIA